MHIHVLKLLHYSIVAVPLPQPFASMVLTSPMDNSIPSLATNRSIGRGS